MPFDRLDLIYYIVVFALEMAWDVKCIKKLKENLEIITLIKYGCKKETLY